MSALRICALCRVGAPHLCSRHHAGHCVKGLKEILKSKKKEKKGAYVV